MDQKKAGVLLSYGQTVLSTLISLVYTPMMLRLLGQSEYGLYTLVNGFISNLALMSFGLAARICATMPDLKRATANAAWRRSTACS